MEQTTETQEYQRVRIPIDCGPDAPRTWLYGIVRMIGGRPQLTHCCSLTPSVWVEGIGYEADFPDEWTEARREEWMEPTGDDGGYFDVQSVERNLSGPIFTAEDEDGAREYAAGNW